MSRIVYAVCWLQVTLFAGIWMYQDQQEALSKGIVFNQWDLMTAVTMNTYLLMYDILLLVLLLSIVRIQRDLTDFWLIRFRNTRSALIHSTGRFAKSWGMGLLVYAIVGYLFALQAPAETNWSLAARVGQVFYIPKDSVFLNISPLLAHCLQLGFLFVGGLLIYLLLGFFYLWTKQRKLLYLLSGLLFLGTGLAFKIGLPSLFFLLSLAALFAHQAYEFWIGCVFVLGIGFLLLDRPIRLPKSGGGSALYLVCCALIFLMQPANQTYGDYLLTVFSGVRSDGFTLQAYLNHAVLFFGYTYLLTQRYERDVINQGLYHIIRHRSLNRWFSKQLAQLFVTATGTVIGLVSLATLFAFLRGVEWTTQVNGLSVDLATILYQTIINGTLQLIVYGLILFLVLYWTRETVQGIYWIGGGMVALLPLVQNDWIPIGRNGTVQLLDHSAYTISIQLVGASLFVYIIIQFVFKKHVRTNH
ncbi:MAG: hypothetical protein WBV68_12185 [Exiguobacterium oxidotolerans]